MARILNRPIDYFTYTGAHLDTLLDDASNALAESAREVEEIAQRMAEMKERRAEAECTAKVTAAILRYRNSGDGGLLLGDFRMLVGRWRYRCLNRYDVYEAIDISRDALREVDMAALRNAALWEMEQYQKMSLADLEWESPTMLHEVSDFLDGKEVSHALVEVLREGGAWAEVATMQLTELVLRAVDTQLFTE